MKLFAHFKKNRTTLDLLRLKSNNYKDISQQYKFVHGVELVTNEVLNESKTFSVTVSIIIVTHNSKDTLEGTLESISMQKLSVSEFNLIEVILVDDGSSDGSKELITSKVYPFKVSYIYQSNSGAAFARNVGYANSTGEILLFLDSDLILQDNYIREHVYRHQFVNNICLVGFRDYLHIADDKIIEFVHNNNKPDIHKDVRFGRPVDPVWKRQHRFARVTESRFVNCVLESEYFMLYGNDRAIGAWDLPSMVQTFSISLRRDAFKMSGGFSNAFVGWGMEDTFFGACLIAKGIYIVPILSTGVFHIEHKVRSGSSEKKQLEFDNNVKKYHQLLMKYPPGSIK